MFDSKYVFCPKCGMRLKENASFCTICGTKIYQENGIATSVNEKINIRVKPTFKLGYFLSLNLFNCFIFPSLYWFRHCGTIQMQPVLSVLGLFWWIAFYFDGGCYPLFYG